MFIMIGIGERAGSGIPDIYQVWENEGWSMPVVEEKVIILIGLVYRLNLRNKRTKQANKNKRTK